jgi:hypothetical protein
MIKRTKYEDQRRALRDRIMEKDLGPRYISWSATRPCHGCVYAIYLIGCIRRCTHPLAQGEGTFVEKAQQLGLRFILQHTEAQQWPVRYAEYDIAACEGRKTKDDQADSS